MRNVTSSNALFRMSADKVYKQAIKRVFGEGITMTAWRCIGDETTTRST